MSNPFYDHLQKCKKCHGHLFNLCPAGKEALVITAKISIATQRQSLLDKDEPQPAWSQGDEERAREQLLLLP